MPGKHHRKGRPSLPPPPRMEERGKVTFKCSDGQERTYYSREVEFRRSNATMHTPSTDKR